MAVALGTILVLAASAPNGTRLPSISTWAPRSPVPEGLVPFNSSESMGLLATADLAAFQQVRRAWRALGGSPGLTASLRR